ncbi:MAG TPA: hypothetical protein ENK16_01925 [Chromatiales bacterium]|nr:hypothetical protein [Chromatiales bacterium]
MRKLFVNLILLAVATSAFGHDWPMPGNDPGGTQFSPLKQITRKNVRKLRVVWRYQLAKPGDMQDAGRASAPALPIVIDGHLYACAPEGQLTALDARSGRPLWSKNPEDIPANGGPVPGRCRGVAYWAEPKPVSGGCTASTGWVACGRGMPAMASAARASKPARLLPGQVARAVACPGRHRSCSKTA